MPAPRPASVTKVRLGVGAIGVGLLGFGVYRLGTEIPVGDLIVLGMWLAGALVIHDGLLSPAVAGVGAALGRWVPPRARRYLQVALVAGALVTVVAIPLIYREGSQPRQKALLLRHYGTNLAILLGIVAAASLLLYAGSVVNSGRRSATNERPPDDHGTPDT